MIVVSIIVAFATAILAGLGVGSGGLYIIFLTLILQVSQTTAQGINLFFYVAALLAGTIFHLVKKRVPKSLLLVLLIGLPLAVLGAFLSSYVPSKWLRKGLGVLLIASGLFAFFKNKKPKNKSVE